MGLLTRFRESSAIRLIEASLHQTKPPEQAVSAMRNLCECGSERAVPILRDALFQDNVALQIQAARALAAIHKRCPDVHILEALNGAVLHERQTAQARQAAIESLTEVIDYRHAGSLVEVLKSNRSPVNVRASALRGLKRLHYPEIAERLVESATFAKRLDPQGEIRKWATRELIALDDRDKLTKMFEIIHGRRLLRYRPLNPDTGPADLIALMVQIDPKLSVKFLHELVEDDNPTVHTAADEALAQLRERGIHA